MSTIATQDPDFQHGPTISAPAEPGPWDAHRVPLTPGAFAHFQQEHADRGEGGVDQQTAELVGAYITTID